jgi:hypothetical protein
MVRVGLPLTGGRLVAAAREQGYPVLFSANAFAMTYPRGHERVGFFKGFRKPQLDQLEGLDVALDSAGFVAAAHYGDYRWTLEDYYDLVQAYPWTWHAALDFCVEPGVASDRPLRLLRLAATANMLARCRREAAYRGLPPPMPVLQGWTVADYLQCVEWLPLLEWPELVGLGSVCRRPVGGPDGLLSILEAVDRVLPSHVRLHLFGVKSSALDQLRRHPRVASVDSMAWDSQARAERRTGRDMAFRISHMKAWADKQNRIARRPGPAGFQAALFDPADFPAAQNDLEEVLLEAVALCHAELVLSGDLEYASAVSWAAQDGTTAVAMLRLYGLNDGTLREFDDLIGGLGDRVEAALIERQAV